MLKQSIRQLRDRLLPLLLSPILICTQARSLNAQATPPDPQRFKQAVEKFVQWDRKHGPPQNAILFVGSSSITLWNTARFFPTLAVVNRGFGGSHITDVNYYYNQVVKPYNPQKIVFYAGENDVASGRSSEEVLQDFQLFITNVEQDFPGIPVFYLAIKPSPLRWNLWSKLDQTNILIKHWIETKPNLHYVDTASVFLNGSEQPRAIFFQKDGLHLSEQGYAIWQKVLLPYLTKE